MDGRNGKDGKGWGKGPVGMSQCGTRTCADGMGARDKLEIGKVGNGWGEGVVGMSERGYADVCGWCGCQGKVGNGWEEGPVGMSERGSWTCANGMGAREKVGNRYRRNGCVDVCGRCGCKGNVISMCGEKQRWASASAGAPTCADGWVQGKGWKKVGRRTDGHERAWMRGRFLQTVRVQGKS